MKEVTEATPPHAGGDMPRQPLRSSMRLVLLASLGGTLEGYDYLLFGLFAPYISLAFFPTGNTLTSLASTFAVYAGSYLIRPIGGLVMGHFGDRHGRRRIFLLSMLVVSIATLAMGATPSYAAAGVLATSVFILLRLVQGFFVGGEVAGAMTYAAESAGKRLGLACGLLFGIGCMGSVGAAAVNVAVHAWLPVEIANVYGWRLAFVIGGVLGFVFLWARRALQESPAFAQQAGRREKVPLAEVLREFRPQVVVALLMLCLVGTYNALLLAYMPAYLVRFLHYGGAETASAEGIGIAALAVSVVSFGALSDLTSRKWIFRIGALCLIGGAWPLFHALVLRSVPLPILFLLIGAFGGMTQSTFATVLSNLFPTRVRFTGIALCYNVGLAVFQGLTPIVATLLIAPKGGEFLEAPAFVMIGAALIGLLAIFLVDRFPSYLFALSTDRPADETATRQSIKAF